MGVPAVPKCLGIDFRRRTRRLRHKEKARREDLNQIIGSVQNTTCPCSLLAVCWMLGCLHCHLFRENSTSTGFHLHGLHDAASVLHERERITSKTQRRCIQLQSPRDGGQLHAMSYFLKSVGKFTSTTVTCTCSGRASVIHTTLAPVSESNSFVRR